MPVGACWGHAGARPRLEVVSALPYGHAEHECDDDLCREDALGQHGPVVEVNGGNSLVLGLQCRQAIFVIPEHLQVHKHGTDEEQERS